MAIIKTISYEGQSTLSTLSGDIRLETGRGRLVVYDPISGDLRSVQDLTGFHVFNNGTERTRLDERGLTTIRADGSYAIRVGQAGDDNRDGMWAAAPGEDLVDTIGG